MLQPKHIAWLIFTMNVISISSTDIYIPAAPYLAQLFGTDDSVMKLTFLVSPLLASVIGIPFGRYSDKIGRRPFILIAVLLYIIGSFLCMIAPGIKTFLFGRSIQAMGTGGLSVLSGALLADIFAGVTLARYMGILASLYPIVFALAPILGAQIFTYLGWRHIFLVNLSAMLVMLSFIWPILPETNTQNKITSKPVEGIAGISALIFSGAALLLVMIHAAPICLSAIFTINSPFIYIDTFLMTPTEFAYIQAIPVSAQFIGAYIYKSIVERIGLGSSLKFGLVTTMTFVIVASLVLAKFVQEDPYLIVAIISIFSFGATFLISSAATLILDNTPGNKGLTMSYITLTRNLSISLVVGVVSSFHYETIFPVLASMVLIAGIAAILVKTQLRNMLS